MKVSTEEPLKIFKPFELKFEIENLKEAQVIYNIFNFGGICSYLETRTDLTGTEVRRAIERAIPDFQVGRDWVEFIKHLR